MKREENCEKNCENCHHYKQYYIKRSLQYVGVGSGVCNQSYQHSKNTQKEACAFWSKAKQKEEIEESIIKVLRKMARQLHDMALILKENNLNQQE